MRWRWLPTRHAVQKDGNGALEKILGAMSLTARREADRAASRVWMRVASPKRRSSATVLDEGLRRQVAVGLVYRDATGVTSG